MKRVCVQCRFLFFTHCIGRALPCLSALFLASLSFAFFAALYFRVLARRGLVLYAAGWVLFDDARYNVLTRFGLFTVDCTERCGLPEEYNRNIETQAR